MQALPKDADAVMRWLNEPPDSEAENAMNWLASIGSGAAQGATTGMVAGPWGALVGGLLGAGLGAVQQAVQQQQGSEVRPPASAPTPASPAKVQPVAAKSGASAAAVTRPAGGAPGHPPPPPPSTQPGVADPTTSGTPALITQILAAMPQLVALAQVASATPAPSESLDELKSTKAGQLAVQAAPWLARLEPVLAALARALRDAPEQLQQASPVVRDLLAQATPMLREVAQVLAPVAGITATALPPTALRQTSSAPGAQPTSLSQLASFAQLLLQIVTALESAAGARASEVSESLAGDRVPDDAYPSDSAPLEVVDSTSSTTLQVMVPILLQLLPALLPLLAQVMPLITAAARRGKAPLPRSGEAEVGQPADDESDGNAHIETAAPTQLDFRPYLTIPGEWTAESTIAPLAQNGLQFEWTH